MRSQKTLLNLGPESMAWLNAVWIFTRADVGRLGPVAVYLKVKDQGCKPSLNFLYALAGSVMGMRWNQLSVEVKSRLLLELDVCEDQQKRGHI